MSDAVLVLEDGKVFRGSTYGAQGQTLGEAVFCTGMTGYQETLTDPSYHRQIVVATAPQIGNTGWNSQDSESRADDGTPADRIHVAGYAIREPSRTVFNWRADRGSLEDQLVRQGIVGISGIDTRAVVRHLRDRGAMRAGIFSGTSLGPVDGLQRIVQAQPAMLGADLAREVSTDSGYIIEPAGEPRFEVAAVDLGMKASIPEQLAARGCRVHVLPSTATLEQVEAVGAHGFFLSNGPGDPATADTAVQLTRGVIGKGIPMFGICFGNQILGRALGRRTYKMRFGHRGMNIPVIDEATGRVAITSQNHGFALEGERGEEFDTPFGRARVSHVCANDGTVEGVELLDGTAFSVQYHPEAAAGPHDARYLFDRFGDLMDRGRKAGGK
ncbi:glutamine-hydrolyzing carbamoyl-phosphate synthase small subunit [Tomitella fengzijianii]|uniref:glutamine-hydrolyzing carbamoyl-phosphate synthase small subunit n=1 Tax=Tomitella fengzijianii TaxID=2597660 RepID=UPI001E4BD3DD|nr:glutamine-hydrolyzing carbamoyl-phosphate synthase small subunit [Tomitella fengzijianii]